ncbi:MULTISPECIES: BON domain-containing protein [Micromonospora]|uniref:BON domain-containing protein n=1 Tax=Micromonospora chalcea TaxID=1874 RepID=A0ABX9Y4Y8_MICCH|nr:MULTISPECIES: BON domain-containing protein [Micromonospora]MBC8993405.1 BON domain-containing protein [Micromonospora chalcea]MCK1807191.1 BON domain-containing protein [Micromonospora sp. R42106]MCK1831181.1 BON domain-containing protein [Micromonospora sp. R42003]MCK1842850.1 BON domain-containing protein [Micromonospora sp. R42004]MCM1019034.1 BON domain-containing protein [Micromonospora sp. XM-20-01]
MTTTSTVRTDQLIQRDVLAELDWDAQTRATDVGVTVADGVVTLTGRVDSYARRWAVERCAHRVRGVRAVASDLEVDLTATDRRTDADIAIAAGRALEWDSFVPAERLDVTVADGWVMLRGEVEFGFQRRTAERELRRLRGVRGVTNLIEVRPPAPPSDEQQRLDLRRLLLRRTGTERIDARVDGDTVVLDGVVGAWWQREEAERAAWALPGVREVHVGIVVSG